MAHFDFSPLYRSTVGFDRLAKLMDSMNNFDSEPSTYPPYNIELIDENAYRITMAVAGFAENEIDVEVNEQNLQVRGERTATTENAEYLHRGIATRSFERRFQLADYVEVTGATLENGLLHIDLKRELPEKMKPRKIEVAKSDKKVIEANRDV